MLHRQFVAPIMDGNRITGIITESKSGREAILADRVIDATGDADVAERAGATTIETTGKEDDMFSPFLMKPFKKAIEEGLIPPNLNTIAGTWGAMHDTGELTYMS